MHFIRFKCFELVWRYSYYWLNRVFEYQSIFLRCFCCDQAFTINLLEKFHFERLNLASSFHRIQKLMIWHHIRSYRNFAEQKSAWCILYNNINTMPKVHSCLSCTRTLVLRVGTEINTGDCHRPSFFLLNLKYKCQTHGNQWYQAIKRSSKWNLYKLHFSYSNL